MFSFNISHPQDPDVEGFPLKSRTEDIVTWTALQKTTMFTTDGSVRTKLTNIQSSAFQQAKTLALRQVQQAHSPHDDSSRMRPSSITGSWSTTLNTWDRNDFLFLIQDKVESTLSSGPPALVLVHVPYRGGHFPLPRRVDVVQPTPIAVLTAFACRLETLENYLDVTVAALEEVLQGQKRVILAVAKCMQKSRSSGGGGGGGGHDDPVSKWRIESMLKSYRKRHAGTRSKCKHPVKFQVLFVDQPFSRPLVINKAARLLEEDEIAVIVDVDMRVSTSFFHHCRSFAVSGKSAYFPIPFARRKPSDDLTEERVPVSIRKKFGKWDSTSHNTLAIAAIDLKRVGNVGFLNPNALNWGTEGVDLMQAILKSGIRVMRLVDPTIAHHYHKTSCGSVAGVLCLGSSKLLGSDVKLISHWDV